MVNPHWGNQNVQSPANTGKTLATGNASIPAATYTSRYEIGALQWSAPPGETRQPTLMISNPVWGDVFAASYDGSVGAQYKFGVTLSYGQGPAFVKVDFDLRSGAITLPPVSSVKCGLYITPDRVGGSVTVAPTNTIFQAQMSLSECAATVPAEDVPTFTCIGMLAGGYPVPVGAEAVQLLSEGQLTFSTYNQKVSMSAAGVLYPGYAPVRVPGGGNWTYVPGATDTAGLVQFSLRL